MNHAAHYFAKILFRNKVYEYKGAEFQKFFVEIMGKATPNFRSIKPQGPHGDWKNDGYDSRTGVFYQVYAPEQPEEIDVTKAVKKLSEAFEEILEKWNQLTPVQKFFFVFNDEFRYSYPEVEAELLKLTQKHNIPCEPFLARDLQRVFESLSDEDKMFCLRCPIPDVDELYQVVNFEAFNEVIACIQRLPIDLSKPDTTPPHFEDKIQFNFLSRKVADLLNGGQHQIGALERYFELEYDLKILIKEKLSGLYEMGKTEISGEYPERNDEIFFYIFDKICPEESKIQSISNAVIILMSYYFAYCDIFEHPKRTLFD